MNSDVSAELLVSLFVTSTPLHDGAVIIQGDKIACASAYFPPTNMDLPSRYGARHRAAIGISEITDAVTIIVSEETGTVSITEGGKIFHVDREQLNNYLLRVICGEATEVKRRRQTAVAPAVVVESSEPEPAKKESVLGKLAVKKQNIPVSGVKAEVEEVIPAGNVSQNAAASASVQGSRFDEADREASKAEIKLPHKKDRPRPSYPERKDTAANPAEQTEAGAPQRKKARPSSARMTQEEVQAAREASMRKLSRTEEPEPIIDLEMINDEENRKYDTSKLDISKIVGFDNELDQQFEMIESMKSRKKNASPDGEGGDAS
jgi:hypothetical protein